MTAPKRTYMIRYRQPAQREWDYESFEGTEAQAFEHTSKIWGRPEIFEAQYKLLIIGHWNDINAGPFDPRS